MKRVSRRSLAKAIVREMLAGRQPKPLMKSVAAYLLLHRMTDQADLLIQDIAYELFNETGHLVATMESAKRLSQSLEADLKQYLKHVTGAKRVELGKSIDPSLIGGVRLSIPGGELDLTISRQLKQLQGIQT
ncbi:MAG TPA: F0F1 ATP synthase subunit delta [Candidatus Saccharimonadales bacterium]|nr:F0F1 ATP synthase subunit delta [Candidatus Saccharimonadales bacterium]